MAKPTKRLKKIEMPEGAQAVDDAFAAVAGGSGVKFDETVDVAVRLGIDPKKSDQNVRGSVVLPAGTGKTVRVAVVSPSEEHQQQAKDAGADIVGFEELIKTIGGGQIDFDILLATPDAMRQLSAAAKVLGPRGLMPNPKNDTVTKDPAASVKLAKSGQIRFRSDKYGIVHAPIGKASFAAGDLKQNFDTLIAALKKIKPSSTKGIYLRSSTVSCTMGKSARIDIAAYR